VIETAFEERTKMTDQPDKDGSEMLCGCGEMDTFSIRELVTKVG
jgi:hypothetical protein